jgi:hypothetical protein
MFEYTRSEFWGGPSIPYWVLAVFTVMFGFIGLDHILLRSPTTALIKFIFNIFTLGLWYFYDVIQVIGDKDKVMNYGLTAPLYGPLGIGAGMFTDNQPGVTKSTAPWRFLLYSMLVFVPFGLDSVIGGDTAGGVIKFICTIIPIFWPILFFWMVLSVGRLYLFPKPLFTEGIDRPFPVSFFVDKKGKSVLGPIPVPPESSEFNSDYSGFLGMLPPYIRSLLTFMFPGLIPAVDSGLIAAKAASNAATAGFSAAKVAAETAGTAIEGTKKVIEAATSVAAGAASGLPALVATGTGAASAVTGSLQKYKNPEELMKMVGGGVEESSTLSNIVLLAGFAVILGGGVYCGLKRLNNSAMSIFRRESYGTTGTQEGDSKGRKRDDSPPQSS